MDGDCKVLATAIMALMIRRVARSSERFSSKESCGTSKTWARCRPVYDYRVIREFWSM
jgi:hypothetical protein